MSVTLRPALPDDEAFLYESYCSTRSEEMAAWGFDEAQQQKFLKLQFTAQRRHYDIAFHDADKAACLYERLGFSVSGDTGAHYQSSIALWNDLSYAH